MDVILIPGFWLNAASWDGVVPALEAAGHRVRALTLPGLASIDDDRAGVGLADHVAAVVQSNRATSAGESCAVATGLVATLKRRQV